MQKLIDLGSVRSETKGQFVNSAAKDTGVATQLRTIQTKTTPTLKQNVQVACASLESTISGRAAQLEAGQPAAPC
jgi:hypothetical protein